MKHFSHCTTFLDAYRISLVLPLALAATASTPIAAGLLLAGMSPGTVLVFF